ncbi:MAG: glutaminyl-peptide cyclotransferase [Pyrinomonadaceae bacterium]
MRLYFIIFILLFLAACDDKMSGSNANLVAANKNNGNSANTTAKISETVPVYTYEIVNTFKHDSDAFTQGLIFNNGFLYESTGHFGDSTLRKVDLQSGKILQKHKLKDDIFAEGMTVLNGKIYQISWQNYVAFVYDLNNLKLLKELKYAGEGWGLTNDGTNLLMSDGTHIIKVIDPETFKTVRSVPVLQENGKPLYLLNELEFVKGEIWANIWHSEEKQTNTTQGDLPNIGKPNYIARINPESGRVVGWIDLANISPEDSEDESENTLNGIAYDVTGDRIFVTGKNWKKLFEIKIKSKG